VADPQHGNLDLLGWVQFIAAAVVTALGSVLAWWKTTRQGLYRKVDEAKQTMETDLKQVEAMVQMHDTKIAVLQTQQINTHQQLQAIHEDTREIRDKIGGLSDTLTDVLLEIKRGRD
jgi:K+ transporter